MPRLRKTRPVGWTVPVEVPEELKTRLHPMWQDDDAIRAFCAELGLSPWPWQGPLTAYTAVVTAYAAAQGWQDPYPELEAAGVLLFYGRLEQRERRRAFYPDWEMTPERWEIIRNTERQLRDGTDT